jgi:hypothetical protein
VCPLIELFDGQPIAGAGARQMQFSLDFDNAKEDISGRSVPESDNPERIARF